MGLVAVIVREPKLLMTYWLQCIDSRVELLRPKPRVIVNPFTGTRRLHTPRQSEVEIRIGDAVLGAIESSSELDDDGELHVYAPSNKMAETGKQLVEAIAACLGGDVIWAE